MAMIYGRAGKVLAEDEVSEEYQLERNLNATKRPTGAVSSDRSEHGKVTSAQISKARHSAFDIAQEEAQVISKVKRKVLDKTQEEP
jgi:hypothetical protein